MFRTTMTGVALLALCAQPLLAQTAAESITDLNLRAGPGIQFDVIGVIPAGGSVQVDGCVAEANWCSVTHAGTSGWAYGDYLTTRVGNDLVALAPSVRPSMVQVITVPPNMDNTAVGAGAGALAGALLLGGPLAIAGGAIAGAVLGGGAGGGGELATDLANPPTPAHMEFVRTNEMPTVYLDGEVVVGAGIPEGVELHSIPESRYSHLTVNGLSVIVNPNDRRIVTILR